MGLFGTKKLIDDDEWEWQLACFQWLLSNTGGIEEHRKRPLILPTRDFFPSTYENDSYQGEKLFNVIKDLCGMSEWPVRLIQGERTSQDKDQIPTEIVQHYSDVLGTFQQTQLDDGEIISEISYNPNLLDNIPNFIATMAHELSHYLMHSLKTLPPGGHNMEEFATDLCTIFLGFGVFSCNAAKLSEGFSYYDVQGWSVGHAGYLSEHSRLTALAINEKISGRDPLIASKDLKRYLAKDLKKTCKYIDRFDIYSEIMAVDLSEYGDYD